MRREREQKKGREVNLEINTVFILEGSIYTYIQMQIHSNTDTPDVSIFSSITGLVIMNFSTIFFL
jgi:hypothetical protein